MKQIHIKNSESLVTNLLSCTRNFPMSCLGEPLILRNEKRLLHHPQPVVLSHTMKAHFTLDAFNTKCQMVTIQIDLVWKRYIIWCESVTNSLLVRNRYNIQSVWYENVAIQSNLVWKRYNINSIWNNFVWLILGAKSLQYKVIWCENDT